MEENESPELSLAPEPEQSQDPLDTCSQGFGDEAREQIPTEGEDVAKETLEEPDDKSPKANSEVKKTWCFRRSTVAKREMPVEAATDSNDNRCPVRRSGRQPKRTDKLEEFLSTAKRGLRRSAPPSLESGDPPSQTPTDAETASEASFDGNADARASEDAVESPERRTRSSTRKQVQRRSRAGRRTRGGGGGGGGGGVEVKNEGSSENEEDGPDAAKKDQLADKDVEKKDKEGSPSPEDLASATTEPPPPEQDSDGKGDVEKNDHADGNDKVETGESDDETDEEGTDKPRASREDNDDENDSSTSSSSSSSSSSMDSDEGDYDPNALYCICRQKHNKRFMICCDRCEEWFHGDCVGITEARGRLMERNGEDYICPNCTAKKNQVVRPATSILSTSADVGKLKAATSALSFYAGTSAEKSNAGGADAGLSAFQAASALPSSAAGAEEKAPEDMGIKGRIEKATNPTGKKKIKIFQPQALQQPAQPKAEQKAAPAADKKTAAPTEPKAPPATEEKVALNVEVKTTPPPAPTPPPPPAEVVPKEQAAEDSSLPKCIGPGCENNAQPDSVYCGNGCILRHAAAAMKSITDVKEPAQTAQRTRSAPKRSVTGGRKKKAQQESDSEEDHSDDEEEEEEDDEDDDDYEDEHAVDQPPPPATAISRAVRTTDKSTLRFGGVTLESEENRAAGTRPPGGTAEKSRRAMAEDGGGRPGETRRETRLIPKTPQKEEKPIEKDQKEKDPVPAPEIPPPASAPPVKGNKKYPATRASKVIPKGKKPSPSIATTKGSRKPAAPPSRTAAKSKKPGQAPAHVTSRPPGGPIHATGALRVTKSNFTIPKKAPQHKEAPTPGKSSSSSSSRVPSTPAPTAPSSHSSSSRSAHPPHPASSAAAAALALPPNNQMRTNIRRSLTDIIYKRVNDSDDLKKTENEVTRLCVAIEKEMFNLCLNTDSRYKNKYRSLMFNLKDPKNKGLFYRVVGGEVSPFRLVRLSAEELLSKEISEWKKPDGAESPGARGHSKSGSRHDASSHGVDLEDAPPTSDTDDQDESCVPPSASAQPSAAEGNSGMLDIFGTMLKDTTSQHRTHLFDLNCKICTDPSAYPTPPSYPTNMEPAVPESLQQLDFSMLAQAPAPIINPTVSSVSITRRDPRMARHSAAVTVTYPPPEKPINNSAEPLPAPGGALVDAAPKAPLPMPPAPPPASKTAKASSSAPPPDGETAIFLHGQEKIWKGLIHMPSVAKFVTKAYLVSGSFEHLKEDLPDIIHVGGRILPSMVWDYVGKLKTSLSKELCLIRFHPATEEEEAAYVSLFSYFSSRKRFGVVANNNRRIKDLYLIPLSSKDPLPSKLLPFDGPGLEPARPNLLLGLLICQKDRKRAAAPMEAEEKRFKMQTKDADDTGLPKPSLLLRTERSSRQSHEIPFSTTPPGSPPVTSSETSSSSAATSSVFSFLSSIKATSATAGRDSPSSSSSIASSATTATPLQTILKTLFGKKKQDSEASNSPSDPVGELSVQASTMLDPIVQQFAHISKEKQVEEDEDDRPYDPEEEYDPGSGYNLPKKPVEVVSKPDASKQSDANEVDDVAYDPEDDSIFEDVKPVVPIQNRDPRQSRDPRQPSTGNKPTDDPEDQEEKPALSVDSTLLSQAVVEEPPVSDVAELPDSSQGPDTSLPREEVKSETLPFMQSNDAEVAIPLLGEDVDLDMEINYMDEPEVKIVEAEPIKAETELDMYSIWPNAASILKANEDSDYEDNSQDASNASYYDDPTSTIPLTIPVLTQSKTMGDPSKSLEPYHMPRHMSGYDGEYRPSADLPQISNFPPPHSMQGQNLTGPGVPHHLSIGTMGLNPRLWTHLEALQSTTTETILTLSS
ncbi:Death-inducer obliterator 1 [Liparis tanakae]|uniref:Death-inducer obliterator 1 n=1 Tax=Liparis tanakae TaxID=230148 RepID=A0A4Z2GSD6_9TELE|nr:Death-inducer obliterator 1 [Liparis tanakae]